jgi:hypothetical protein
MKLRSTYSSPNIIKIIVSRRIRCAGHAARTGENRNTYSVLVRKPQRNKPPGISRSRWEDSIKTAFRGIGLDGMDWIDPAQDREQWGTLMNTVISLRVP